MKLRFPLFAKIISWFFLNLLLLGAVGYVFFRVQFHLGLDLLLAGPAGARVDALGRVMAEELRSAPEAQWPAMLQRFAAGYGVQLALARPDGVLLAGAWTNLPPEVRARLAGFAPPLPRPLPPEGRERPWRLRRGPGAAEPSAAGPEVEHPPPAAGPDAERPAFPAGVVAPLPPAAPRWAGPPRRPPPRWEGGPGAPPEGAAWRQHPKFMVRSTQPPGYWVGLRLPGRPEQAPQVLLLFSPTLSGGGLFLDLRPWLLAGVGAVLLAVLFWLPLVRGITRALAQLMRAAGQIAEGRFEVRVDERRRDELGRLGAEINRMAARLDGLVAGQKRFLGDVAHELCSPLARMQVALGILEQRAEAAQRDSVNDVREDLQEMSNLVNELLSFSKASLRGKSMRLQAVPLADLARRVAAREGGVGGRLDVRIADGLAAQAEPDLLARALANLVRNALRYAGGAGPVVISAEPAGPEVVVRVSDAGPGVPADALQKIFDPFFRLESSRSRDTGGMGLGLAIVRTCVEACQGSVAARNREPSGLEVTIRLKA